MTLDLTHMLLALAFAVVGAVVRHYFPALGNFFPGGPAPAPTPAPVPVSGGAPAPAAAPPAGKLGQVDAFLADLAPHVADLFAAQQAQQTAQAKAALSQLTAKLGSVSAAPPAPPAP